MPMRFYIEHPNLLLSVIPEVQKALGARRKIALHGEMGAGKTTFVKAFCQHLGVTEPTASPTFGLVHTYAYRDAAGQPAAVHHLDLYRLRRPEEAFEIGLEDMLYDPFYCFIEWPALAESLFPDVLTPVTIQIEGPMARNLLLL